MKKHTLVVAICLMAAMATLAFAKAVKVDLVPVGAFTGGGKAVLNYAAGADKTEVQVNLWGLNPNKEYRVRIGHVYSGWLKPNPNGKLSVHLRPAHDWSGARVRVNERRPYRLVLRS